MVRTDKSSQRERSAAFTRQVVLRAAEDLFTSRGYTGTTVADIARQADVAVTTVYGSVGNKSEIVLALILSGADDPVTAATTESVLRSETPHEAIACLAAGVCESIQKLLPLITVMYDTASTDPAIAEAVAATERSYRANLTPLALHLRENGWLKKDLSDDEVLDILWFYFGIPPLRTLHGMGWSWHRTQTWLTRQAVGALLT